MTGISQSSAAQDAWIERVLGVAVPLRSGADLASLSAAITAWREASESVDGQISALQSALRASDDEELREIGEFGLNAITGDHKVKLMAAMLEAERGDAGVHKKLAGIAAQFRDFLGDDEKVEACDENPLGVAVSVRATLIPVLDQIEKALTG